MSYKKIFEGIRSNFLYFFSKALLLSVPLSLTACTFVGDETSQDTPGFFYGIWHGLVAPYTLVVRWFIDIHMYAVPNSGWFYDFGFLLGILGAGPFGWLATIISILHHIL